MSAFGLDLPQGKDSVIIPVHAQAVVWLAVVADIQLALRHPLNTGASAPIVRDFARQVLAKLLAEEVITPEQATTAFGDI